MGEVCRATDTKLNRDVALKILPEQFASDSQRMGRFQREAEVLASLDHPNIGQIYGIEDAGQTKALVLQLIEGPTLADKISQGPIPVGETLKIALQIAEGLEAAHEKGVIHRDLKPANIKITPEGQVKILDFGLAKALEDEAPPDSSLSQSPTLTAAATQAGVILGTAAYMSPEQAKGKAVDKRADIFAFGAVLYECLTGKRAFEGEDISDTLASILAREPSWEALPSRTPESIRRLLRRCLQKDLKQRFRDIGDGRIEIEEVLAAPTTEGPVVNTVVPARLSWRQAIPLVGALVAGAIIASIAVWNLKPLPPPTPRLITRLTLTLPPNTQLTLLDHPAVALSPEGNHLVHVADTGGSQQLYLRNMDSLETRPIPGTVDARAPFFSPNGQWVGFFAEGKLKKVSISDGRALNLCEVSSPGSASWGANDIIVFATGNLEGLWQVSAAGGTPQVLTTPDSTKGETGHKNPWFLPGSKALLFSVLAASESYTDRQLVVLQLETGERRDLTLERGGSNPRYVPTGHLVYALEGTLMAVPFNLANLKVAGTPVPIVEGVMQSTAGSSNAQFSFSSQGSLVYVSGGMGEGERTLMWVDRKGAAQPLTETSRAFESPRLSPDGQRVAVTIREGNTDVWVYDLRRSTLTRFTTEESEEEPPTWTPDGNRLTFAASRPGEPPTVFLKAADGSGDEDVLLTSEYHTHLGSWSPDGQTLVWSGSGDLWFLELEGGKPRPFLQTRFAETSPRFSPDGKWLAYNSDKSGRQEVYLQPFPGPGSVWQISSQGGEEPVWALNGGQMELFYRNGDRMMVVDITTEASLSVGTPRLLFEGRYWSTSWSLTNYDVSPDGQRFLMVKEDSRPVTQMNVVQNWFEELRRLVPTN